MLPAPDGVPFAAPRIETKSGPRRLGALGALRRLGLCGPRRRRRVLQCPKEAAAKRGVGQHRRNLAYFASGMLLAAHAPGAHTARGRSPLEREPSGVRWQFAATLGDVARGAARGEQAPEDADRQNGLLRRLHAVGFGASVLGFASVAEALAERSAPCERPWRRTSPHPSTSGARTRFAAVLVLARRFEARGRVAGQAAAEAGAERAGARLASFG